MIVFNKRMRLAALLSLLGTLSIFSSTTLALPILTCLDYSCGSFGNNSSIPGYDWSYPTTYSRDKSVIDNGGTVYLQSYFVWDGHNGDVITTDEHGIVAFTSGAQSGTSSAFPPQSPLFEKGAGAFVRYDGLSLELWNVNTAEKGWRISAGARRGTPIFPGQYLLDAPGLPSNKSLRSYIEDTPPGFQLKKGTGYWVRVTLSPSINGTGWAYLKGELFEGTTLKQQAAMDIVMATWLPESTLKATIGRGSAMGNDDVLNFWSFDHF